MTNTLNAIALYPPGTNPSDEVLITGDGSLAYVSRLAPSGEDISQTITGLSPSTSYDLEWIAFDAEGSSVRAPTVNFTTTAILIPIAPTYPPYTSYEGVAVSRDMSVGWANVSEATFTASTLPTGLSISTAGLVTGTPSAEGSFNTRITATNQYGTTNADRFAWSIVEQPPAPTATAGGLRLSLKLHV